MRWSEIDLKTAMWNLPKEATKAGRKHDVPLSKAAVALLEKLPRFGSGDYVWTTTSGAKPINGFSKIKSRIDKHTKDHREEKGIEKNIEEWTMHDLRRTAATLMAKDNVAPHVLAAILNHAPEEIQGITSIYNRFRYTEERRVALEAWSLLLSKALRAEKKRGTATARRAATA